MVTTSRSTTVLAGLADIRGWQEEFYRDLHQHPELSHQEHRTAARVAERLRAIGFSVHEGIGGTGVVAVLGNGDGPTVLLRADMDALPVKKATGLPYASTTTATDAAGGEVPVMHACGHDVHVSCLLGAAQLLAEGAEHWSGTAGALFQPAGEAGRPRPRRPRSSPSAVSLPGPRAMSSQIMRYFSSTSGRTVTRPAPRSWTRSTASSSPNARSPDHQKTPSSNCSSVSR